jgi:hypothetical protein
LIYSHILPYLVEENRYDPFLLCLGFTILMVNGRVFIMRDLAIGRNDGFLTR